MAVVKAISSDRASSFICSFRGRHNSVRYKKLIKKLNEALPPGQRLHVRGRIDNKKRVGIETEVARLRDRYRPGADFARVQFADRLDIYVYPKDCLRDGWLSAEEVLPLRQIAGSA